MNLYQEIAQRLKDADTVIIGASNGLSISEGLNIFADDLWFQENFGDFREKYGIHSLIEGAFCRFSSEQEKWAFTSRYVSKKSYLEPPSRMMRQLYDLVKEKDYFVVTTNGEDHFVPAGFSPERVFEMEGKNTEMRCSRGCCDEVYYNREAILCMAQAEQNGVVPQELLPVCPRCGGPMDVNMANNQRFFQTRRWQEKWSRQNDIPFYFKISLWTARYRAPFCISPAMDCLRLRSTVKSWAMRCSRRFSMTTAKQPKS